MDRPQSASRRITGLQPAPGTALERPARPQSAMRGAAGMQARSTAMQGLPPGTAGRLRPVTGALRPGTAARQRGMPDVQTQQRPMTQQGMGGLQTAGGNYGRQVMDKTYFMNGLRQKRSELLNVNTQLQEGLDSDARGSGQHARLQQALEAQQQQVAQLQGQLADSNAVLDCSVMGRSASEVQAAGAQAARENAATKARIDAVYAEREGKRRQVKDAEEKAAGYQASMEVKLSQLPPHLQQQYQGLQDARQRLAGARQQLEGEVGELDRRLGEAEAKLAANPTKQRALAAQEQVEQLSRQRAALEAEAARPRLLPDQQRSALLAQIKADNETVEAAMQAARAAAEAVRRLEGRLGDVEPASATSAGLTTQQQHEELLQREQNVISFLKGLEATRAARLAEQQAKQISVRSLLEQIAQAHALTSQGAADALATPSTQARLREELAARRAELGKIDALEERIGQELAALAAKQQAMQGDLTKLAGVEQVETEAKQRVSELQGQLTVLQQRRDQLAPEVATRNRAYDSRKAVLEQGDAFVQLQRLEQQSQLLQELIKTSTDLIRAKEAEANYRPLLGDVTNLVSELNVELQTIAASM